MMWKCWAGRLLFVGVVAILQLPAVALEPLKVGPFGAADRLVVEGSGAFSNAKIRDTLLRDFEVVLASHPAAMYSDYARTLQQRCHEGFLSSGFPEAKVQWRFDHASGNTVIAITEGPRFRKGTLRVVGARRIDAEQLIELVQRDGPVRNPLAAETGDDDEQDKTDSTSLAAEGPLWPPGKPVNYFKSSAFGRRGLVTAVLAEMGFHNCQFKCEILPSEDAALADLQITILDEGSPAKVREAIVAGAERNTRQAILDLVDFHPGETVRASDLARMQRQLRQSGRFIKQQVRLLPPDDDQQAFRLHIDVMEYARATPLGEPLTEAEQALLKCQRWISSFEQRDVDLVVQTPGADSQLRMVLSPQEGWLVTTRLPASSDDSKIAEYQFGVARGEALFYLADHPEHLAIRSADVKPQISLGLKLSSEGDQEEHPRRIFFGVGLHTLEEGDPPVELELNFDPAAILSLAHEHDAVCEIKDDTLCIRSRKGVLEVNTKTGQPRKIDLWDDDQREWLNVSFVQGEYESSVQDLRQRIAQSKNVYDPRRPVSSTLAFFADRSVLEPLTRRLLSVPGRDVSRDAPLFDREMLAVAHKLIDAEILSPLDAMLLEITQADDTEEDDHKFQLPIDHEDVLTGGQLNMAQGYARLFFPQADLLFRRESWPWTLWRESCLLVAGETTYTQRELDRLHNSGDTGPLCYLATAELLTNVSRPLAGQFATRGLEVLTVTDFRNEYDVLLDQEYPLGQCLQRAAGAIGQLNEQETAALGRWLLGGDGQQLVVSTRLLRENRDRPLSDVLPMVLDELWRTGMSKKVEALLRQRTR